MDRYGKNVQVLGASGAPGNLRKARTTKDTKLHEGNPTPSQSGYRRFMTNSLGSVISSIA